MVTNNKKKVSIIVPVYNLELYIEKCLNSLVNQTLKDLEIIVVNDGSTDKSVEIIEKMKKQYPNLIKTYNISNVGVAKARNFGLSKATGEYIGFVDGDDYVSKDMYEKLYNKAIEEDSDIVTSGYYKVKKEKCEEKGTKLSNCFGYDIHMQPNILIESFPYIWNKIFKRNLIIKNKIEFENLKIYEDLVFTYKLYFNANKISKVDEPLYYYIVTRESSATYEFTEKRFDIFKAFDSLIEYMKNNNCFEEFKNEILYILLKHIYVVLEQDISKESIKLKKEYLKYAFKYLNKNFKNWEDNIYFRKLNKSRLRYCSKTYWKIRMYVNKHKRKKIKSILNKIGKISKLFNRKKFIGKKFMKYMKKPIKEKTILLNSQQGNNINGNMFYILKELQNNVIYKEYKIYVAYIKGKKRQFKDKLKNYGINKPILIQINTNKYAKKLATCKFLFSDTSFSIYFIKREEQIYLNTWHGTPLKTLGKATAQDFYDIANLQKNFATANYLLYPSHYMKDIMTRDYMLNSICKGKAILSGYPRNEIFFNKSRRNDIKKKLNLENKQLIAYMPTWRGTVRKVSLKQQLKEVKEYLQEIDNNLKETQIMYVNFHPYVGNNIDFSIYKNIYKFPQEYETYDFLNICDILITDYSSVFFDYALTKNKIILFTYDEEKYFRDRGMYISLEELPFPKVSCVNQLIKEINTPKNYNDREFLEKYCKYDESDMSKKICEKVILRQNNTIKEEVIKNDNKKNILIYAGSLNKNKQTDYLIELAKNTNKQVCNYYISYITKNVKKNKRQLKELNKNGINYMGQLGSLSNNGRIDNIILALASRIKFINNIFRKKIDKLYKVELKRNYNNLEFKAIILFGKIGIRKIDEFSNFNGKKIIYLTDKNDFNKNVNKKVYNKFDYIIVPNRQVLEYVQEYCKNNVMLIENIDNLNAFNIFN